MDAHRPPFGEAYDHLDRCPLGLCRAGGEVFRVAASRIRRGRDEMPRMFRVHHQGKPERGKHGKGDREVVLAHGGDFLHAGGNEKALEGKHSRIAQWPKIGSVARHHAADEAHIDAHAAPCRRTLDLERSRRGGGGNRVERHVEKRRHAASDRRARRRLEPLPFRPAGLVHVHVGVHEPGHDHEVAGVVQGAGIARVIPRRDASNAAVEHMDAGRLDAFCRHDPA